MATQKPRLWLRIVGYAAFSLVALVVAFFVTFPYDAAKDRLRREADAAGYFLRVDSMGPGFFSVRAKGVQVSKKSDADPPPEALRIDSLSVGPALFPPGLKVRASALGGDVTATVSGLSGQRITVVAEGLDTTRGNLEGFTGVKLSGEVSGRLDLDMPKSAAGAQGPGQPDLSLASGSLRLTTHALSINGGSAEIPIPQFGPEPTPIDLPKIVLGDLTGDLKIEKGAVTVETFKNVSPDIELNVSGTLKLARRLPYSEANLEVRFKPDPEFQKRLGMLGSALSFVRADPKDPQWRLGHLTGLLGRPQFR